MSPTGSDSNNGLSAGSPFLTIQFALNLALNNIDLAGSPVWIHLAAGTYTAGVSMSKPQVGAGNITIFGDTTTPANCTIALTNGNCISVSGYGSSLNVQGVKLSVSGSGNCLNASNGGLITVNGKCEIGACGGTVSQIFSGNKGIITISASYNLSGGGAFHWDVAETGQIVAGNLAITLSNTPAFSSFVRCGSLSYLACQANTFPGTAATGQKVSSHEQRRRARRWRGRELLAGQHGGSGINGRHLLMRVYDINNWFWAVADSDPEAQVYSSAAGVFVALDDPDYEAWSAEGDPTAIDTAANLGAVLIDVLVVPIDEAVLDGYKTAKAERIVAADDFAITLDHENRLRSVERTLALNGSPPPLTPDDAVATVKATL